jgi:hypothetical protein
VALALPFFDRVSLPQVELMLRLGISHQTFLATSGLVIVALVLPAAAGFGIAFPAVVDILSRAGRGAGGSVAVAYAVNHGTIYAMPPLLDTPVLGTQRTPRSASSCAGAAALTLLAGPGPSARRGPHRRSPRRLPRPPAALGLARSRAVRKDPGCL